MKKMMLTDSAIKKITLTAAVGIALLFALATGMATITTPSYSPATHVFGHYGSVPPLW